MRFDPQDDDTSNIEDRRGSSGGGYSGGGMGGGMRLGLGGTVVLVVLSLALKRNLFTSLNTHPAGPGPGYSGPAPGRGGPPASGRAAHEQELERTAVRSFNDSQRFWAQDFAARHEPYRNAKMVLFWDRTQSGCGAAGAEMGPFYCPPDERVYIDLGFYRELATRFGAPGQFAQAYVIAHEVGHHIQNVMGVEHKVRQAQARNPRKQNALSVKMELQADCLAGVWAHSTDQRHMLDRGEIEQGLKAASAVGDDRIQKQATGRVTPETWTHGSAAQRAHWFERGFETGRMDACDTFSAAE